MTLLSLCLKLYMLNVLQYSKLRPLCIIKNQSFPFITQAPSVSTATSSTSTTLSTLSTSSLTTNNTTTTTSIIAPTASITTLLPPVINTRQGSNSKQFVASIGYEYIIPNFNNSNCPNPIEYCSSGIKRSTHCPCFDLRTGKMKQANVEGRSCIGPERDRGVCTVIRKCPLIVEEYYAVLQKRPKISYEEFLILSKCRETADQICCPTRQ